MTEGVEGRDGPALDAGDEEAVLVRVGTVDKVGGGLIGRCSGKEERQSEKGGRTRKEWREERETYE